MARKHYWQFLVTDEGNPIENAQISIYIAGTEDDVYVYTDEVGVTYSAISPQVNTSLKGYFEFWIADENELNGYPLSTKFKIKWEAAGVSSGYIDYIDVFSTSWAPVDETDTNILKNKAVSNFLAKGWEDHKDSELPGTPVHGLDMVDESDNSSSTATDRNKVMSNYQGYLWDTHTRTLWDGSTPTIFPEAAAVTAHGIVPVTISGTDPAGDKNVTVSNVLANIWNDHSIDITTDVHPQYPMADATGTQFIGKITGVSTIASDPSQTLVTKDFVDGFRYTEPIDSTDFTINAGILAGVGTGYIDGTYTTTGGSGAGMTVTVTTYGGAVLTVDVTASGTGYIVGDVIGIVDGDGLETFPVDDIEYLVVHNLGEAYPAVELWDVIANVIVIPEQVETNDINSFFVRVNSNTNHFVRVLI